MGSMAGARTGHTCIEGCKHCLLNKQQEITRDISIQHQCVRQCWSCITGVQVGHSCVTHCMRCRLDKQPNYNEETLGIGALAIVQAEVYVSAQCVVETVDITDVHPTKSVCLKKSAIRASTELLQGYPHTC